MQRTSSPINASWTFYPRARAKAPPRLLLSSHASRLAAFHWANPRPIVVLQLLQDPTRPKPAQPKSNESTWPYPIRDYSYSTATPPIHLKTPNHHLFVVSLSAKSSDKGVCDPLHFVSGSVTIPQPRPRPQHELDQERAQRQRCLVPVPAVGQAPGSVWVSRPSGAISQSERTALPDIPRASNSDASKNRSHWLCGSFHCPPDLPLAYHHARYLAICTASGETSTESLRSRSTILQEGTR